MSIRTATIIAVCGASLSILIGLIHRFGIFPWSYRVFWYLSPLSDVAYLVFFLVLLNRQSRAKAAKP